MAYIIRDDYEDKFIKTSVKSADGNEALEAFFAKTRVNPDTINKANWYTGTPIPPEVVPKKVRIIEGDALYDWRTTGDTGCLVSARFKECVEELDPGRHGFFPVTVEDRHGALMPGPFFLFNVVGSIDSIIEARSNLKATGREVSKVWIYEARMGPWECALDASVIGGRACWTELHYSRRWFVSDRLAALMRARGLIGFTLNEHCEEVTA
jgi:hypothetical protein